MGTLLTGGAYAISSGLILYALSHHYIAHSHGGLVLLIWATAGILLAAAGVYFFSQRVSSPKSNFVSNSNV